MAGSGTQRQQRLDNGLADFFRGAGLRHREADGRDRLVGYQQRHGQAHDARDRFFVVDGPTAFSRLAKYCLQLLRRTDRLRRDGPHDGRLQKRFDLRLRQMGGDGAADGREIVLVGGVRLDHHPQRPRRFDHVDIMDLGAFEDAEVDRFVELAMQGGHQRNGPEFQVPVAAALSEAVQFAGEIVSAGFVLRDVAKRGEVCRMRWVVGFGSPACAERIASESGSSLSASFSSVEMVFRTTAMLTEMASLSRKRLRGLLTGRVSFHTTQRITM